MKKKLTILSLGAGVQSSTLALMAEHGEIDKPDYAIFADTGWEPKHVYEWLNFIESKISFPVVRVSKGNIRDDLIKNIETGAGFSSIPFFMDKSMGRRQCTNEYKLTPIRKKARELLGYEKGQRIPENSITMMVGISIDEVRRMKPSRDRWIKNVWPLIDKNMSRIDCQAWMKKNGYPNPPKSSCIGCPYHNDAHWAEMKKNDPESFNDAVLIDKKLREKTTKGGMKKSEYMHRSLQPLSDVNFGNYDDQLDLFDDECEGICGV